MAVCVSQTANMRRFYKFDVLALVIVAVIGLVYLPQPFHDDQAFFTVGAAKIANGAVLYRDYWDIKQPGIFAFYLAGGKLFGFEEAGVRGFELLYMLGLAVTLILTLRSYFEHWWASGVAVLLTVGFYYGVSGIPHITQDYLTQVEGLVGFPMFLSLWTASTAAKRDRPWAYLFVSGVMGGLVLWLKLLFLPILVVFWFAAFVIAGFREGKNILAAAIRFSVPIFLGLLVPILLTCAYFAHYGALNLLYYTSFLWPVRALGKLPLAGPGRLFEGLEWFVGGFAPVLAFAFVGGWWAPRKKRDIITINLVLWVVVAALVILVQRRSWWPYHYLLLFVPLGILATRGVEWLWRQLEDSGAPAFAKQRHAILVLGLVLLFAPAIFPVLTDALLLARYRFALTKEQRLDYQRRFPHSQYPAILSEIGFLTQPDSLPGPIYVGGSPLIYYLSGRKPAIALSYGIDDFLPEQWVEFNKQLTQARPAYVFLLSTFQEWIQQNSPETQHFIDSNYRVLQRNETGTWYIVTPLRTDTAGG